MNTDFFKEFIVNVITYGGGTTAVIWLILKSYSEKWLDGMFAKKLAAQQFEFSKSLTRLENEVGSLISGAIKIQEIEFKVLPDAWLLLEQAYVDLSGIVMSFSWSQNLDGCGPAQLEEFLAETTYRESEKQSIRDATKKEDTNLRIQNMYKMNACAKSNYELRKFIDRNAIFFPNDVKDKFLKISELCRHVQITQQMDYQMNTYDQQIKNMDKLTKEIEPLKNDIENLIHKRLHEHVYVEVSKMSFSSNTNPE